MLEFITDTGVSYAISAWWAGVVLSLCLLFTFGIPLGAAKIFNWISEPDEKEEKE